MKKRTIIIMCIVTLLLALSGCGKAPRVEMGQHYYTGEESADKVAEENSPGTAEGSAQKDAEEAQADSGTEQESVMEPSIGSDLFMIMSIDMGEESLILEQLVTGKQYMYYYGLTTSFLDKYGNHAPVSSFEPGRVVTIGSKDTEGRLMQIQLSDAVWEYSDIVRFSIDEERGIFTIADTKYSYDADLYVNSDGQALWLADLDPMDEIRAVGIGKKILSVSVTSGHGRLELQNTELFNGSYMQIGRDIFSEVTENMTMELPEGTYTVTVANNGYGGSKDITITRGETTTLDLEELKGEGPKYGNILFAIDVQDAKLLIDGKEVDYSEAISIQYGLHSLIVTADNYSTYSKKLYVNSDEATVVIMMQEPDTVSTAAGSSSSSGTGSGTATDSGTSTDSSAAAGSLAGSLAGSTGSAASTGTSGGSSTNTSGLDAATIDTVVNELLDQDNDSSSSSSSKDYISTLTELLSAITGTD
ncbi:MAG: hypothetical protein ACI4AD_12580 [Roseburia sp.]